MEEMIEMAKKAVTEAYGADGDKRLWLGPVELTPYKTRDSSSPSCLMRFWALEGTPMRGLVIANYGIEEVVAFDGHFKRLKIRRSYQKF